MPAQLDRAYVAARPSKALGRLLAATAFEGRPLSARARWLNPLVFATLAAARALPPLAPVRAPLFLIGTGRSGTTWLGKVLSLHPEVGFLNEPKALWHAAIPDEDLVGSYSRTPARLHLDQRDATPHAARTLARGYGAFLRLTGTRRVLDKYPELVFRVDCVRALFPDARFLLLVRDGADICRSVAAWSAAHGEGRVDWWGRERRKFRILVEQGAAREPDLAGAGPELSALTRQEDMAALEWLLAMRAGYAAAERHPRHVLAVRYEDLVGRPRESVARALGFAGLTSDERVLAYAQKSARVGGPPAPLELAPILRGPFERTENALLAGPTHPGAPGSSPALPPTSGRNRKRRESGAGLEPGAPG